LHVDVEAPTAYRFWPYLRDGFYLDASTAMLQLRMAFVNAPSSSLVLWTLKLQRLATGSFVSRTSFKALPQCHSASAPTRAARFAAALRSPRDHAATSVLDTLMLTVPGANQ
jgi:hypothetical protein